MKIKTSTFKVVVAILITVLIVLLKIYNPNL